MDLYAGKGGTNFKEFITKYLPQYLAVDTALAAAGRGGLYSSVRSGLVHTYYMKGKSRVDMGLITTLATGITFDTGTGETVFYVRNYYADFMAAFKKYYNDFSADSTGNFLTSFNRALNSAGSGFVGGTGGLTSSSGNTLP